eukprot:1915445-Alexandrium_andersonii.AAC.1
MQRRRRLYILRRNWRSTHVEHDMRQMKQTATRQRGAAQARNGGARMAFGARLASSAEVARRAPVARTCSPQVLGGSYSETGRAWLNPERQASPLADELC